MRTLLRRLGIVAGIAMAAFVLSMTNAGQALAQNMKPVLVQVINSASEAVPVTGIVRVANAAGAPLDTRDVSDFAARNAFSQQIRVDVTGFASADFTIPSGKRLVAECVSVSGFDRQDGGDPGITLHAILGDSSPTFYQLAPVRIEPSSPNAPEDVYAGTQLVRFYADALRVSINLDVDTAIVGSFIVTVSGYLVDQP
jgi:hypothetical protein